MRAHIAAGIEGHPRGTADRRLHIGVREAHAELCQPVDIRCFQRRMAGAPQIVMAKLIAHDPDDVVGARHVRRFGDFKRPDAATWNSQRQARGRRKPGLAFVVARFLYATCITSLENAVKASSASKAPPAPRPWPFLTPGLRQSPLPRPAARL